MKKADLALGVVTIALAIVVVVVLVAKVVFVYEQEAENVDCMPPLTTEEQQRCEEVKRRGLKMLE